MPRQWTWRAAVITTAVVLIAATGPSEVPAAGDPFAPDVLHEVSLRVHTRDWARLQATYRENTYYPAEATIDGLRVPDVAIRSRGTGSRSAVKPGLRLDLNRYVPGRREWELRSLVLDNLVQDASGLREVLAMRVFAALGLPAPREAFARVYVNGVYYGLYALVEPIDAPLLARSFGESDGELFEYHWIEPWDFSPRPDPADYALLFELETPGDVPPNDVAGAIEPLVRAVADAPDESFDDTVASMLALDAVVVHVAVENALADNDGFAGNWGVNNVYFYRAQSDGRWRVLAWDKDQAFLDAAFFNNDADTNALVRRALANPRLKDLYDATLLAVADLFDSPAPSEAQPDRRWLEAEVERAWAAAAPAAYDDPLRPWTLEEVEAGVEQIRAFARERGNALRRHVGQPPR